jgi:hypothetical protein
MQKLEGENKSIKLGLDKLDYIYFEDDQSLVDAKRRTKRKLKITKRQ